VPVEQAKSIPEFCLNNKISRSTFNNLAAIGRAPDVLNIGGRKIITPEAEAAWRASMIESPILGGVRPAAQKARAVSRGAAGAA